MGNMTGMGKVPLMGNPYLQPHLDLNGDEDGNRDDFGGGDGVGNHSPTPSNFVVIPIWPSYFRILFISI